MNKRCARCKAELPKDCFYRNRSTKDGLQRECKECRKAYSSAIITRTTKRCPRCQVEKKADEFYSNSCQYDGLAIHCKQCARAYRRQNQSSIAVYAKDRYLAKREQILERQRQQRRDRPENYLSYQRKYKAERAARDPNFKLSLRLRARIRDAIRGRTKQPRSFSITECIGSSILEAKAHLESGFREGWTWGNYGSVWEIDHITPLALFDLLDAEEVKKACHYTNLQPLSKEEHIQKSIRDRAMIRQLRRQRGPS